MSDIDATQVAALAVGTIAASMVADGEGKRAAALTLALKAEDWPELVRLIQPYYENLARKNRGHADA